MKNIAGLFFLLISITCNTLFAQRLELESILELNFDPFKIYRIDDERSLVVTENTDVCNSHTLDFLHLDKVVNSIILPEGFVGQVKVNGDEVEILSTIQLFDVTNISGIRRYRYDLNGNSLSEPEDFIFNTFEVEHVFTQAFIAETAEGFFVHNFTGHLYNVEYFQNNYLNLNAQIDGNSDSTKVISLDVYEGTGVGGVVVRQMLYATESNLYTYNYNIGISELISLELTDIRFAGVSDDNKIVVVHGSTVSLFDFELNQVAQADLPQVMDYFFEEEGQLHALKPVNPADSFIVHLDHFYLNFDLNTMLVTEEKTISGVGARVADFYEQEGLLYILSSTGSGKQVVLQKFDLSLNPDAHVYTDISTGNYTVIETKRISYAWTPSIEATLELPIQNLSEEFISELRYSSYFDYIFGFACGEDVFGNVDVQMGFMDEEVIRVKVKCNRFRSVDGGDSLLYTCPCVDIFPYEHHLDIDESNNQVCAQIKVSSLMVSTEEEFIEQNWTLFPNPVKDHLFIQSNDPSLKTSNWLILDLTGRVIDSGVISLSEGIQQIPLNSLNPGMYIFKIADQVSGRLHGIRKLVKE